MNKKWSLLLHFFYCIMGEAFKNLVIVTDFAPKPMLIGCRLFQIPRKAFVRFRAPFVEPKKCDTFFCDILKCRIFLCRIFFIFIFGRFTMASMRNTSPAAQHSFPYF